MAVISATTNVKKIAHMAEVVTRDSQCAASSITHHIQTCPDWLVVSMCNGVSGNLSDDRIL